MQQGPHRQRQQEQQSAEAVGGWGGLPLGLPTPFGLPVPSPAAFLGLGSPLAAAFFPPQLQVWPIIFCP